MCIQKLPKRAGFQVELYSDWTSEACKLGWESMLKKARSHAREILCRTGTYPSSK